MAHNEVATFSDLTNAFLLSDIKTKKKEEKYEKLTIKSEKKRDKCLINIKLRWNSTKITNLNLKQNMYPKHV